MLFLDYVNIQMKSLTVVSSSCNVPPTAGPPEWQNWHCSQSRQNFRALLKALRRGFAVTSRYFCEATMSTRFIGTPIKRCDISGHFKSQTLRVWGKISDECERKPEFYRPLWSARGSPRCHCWGSFYKKRIAPFLWAVLFTASPSYHKQSAAGRVIWRRTFYLNILSILTVLEQYMARNNAWIVEEYRTVQFGFGFHYFICECLSLHFDIISYFLIFFFFALYSFFCHCNYANFLRVEPLRSSSSVIQLKKKKVLWEVNHINVNKCEVQFSDSLFFFNHYQSRGFINLWFLFPEK